MAPASSAFSTVPGSALDESIKMRLLGETPSVLRDVPDISDVQVVRSLLEVHGVRVEDGEEEGTIRLDPSGAVAAHFEDVVAVTGDGPLVLTRP